MYSRIGKETTGPSEAWMLYQDAFLKLKRIFNFENQRMEDSDLVEETLELQNGYKIEASYRPTSWMEVRVFKGEEGVLSFVASDSGLQSFGSRNPSLAFGKGEVRLNGFGLGLEGELQAVNYPFEESENMDILGAYLADWLETSVKAGKLKPLDIALKFPLLPQK